jgi:sortase A
MSSVAAVLPRPAGRSDDGLTLVRDALLMLSIVTVWVVVQVLFLGGLSESRAQATLYAKLRSELAAATAPTGGMIAPGRPVALLRVPRLGLQQVVVEGTASGDLEAGPGHRRDTPLPGQEGVSVVYGRASTYGAPFRSLASLQPGDPIVAVTQQGRVTFVVDGVRRAGDPLPAPLAAGQSRLTLVSAEGSGTLGALSAGSPVYVDATMSGTHAAFVAKPGRPLAVPEAEQTLAADSSALPLLALCLAALLAAAAWYVVARRRWSPGVVWVVTAPVLVGLAWATTDVAVRLLPNLL